MSSALICWSKTHRTVVFKKIAKKQMETANKNKQNYVCNTIEDILKNASHLFNISSDDTKTEHDVPNFSVNQQLFQMWHNSECFR